MNSTDGFPLMHLSMVCNRMGGGGGEEGNPQELDSVKHTWVGIFTFTTVPRVGNFDLTTIILGKLRGPRSIVFYAHLCSVVKGARSRNFRQCQH